ncbi:glycine zipper 2TM domain-containing protein [Novosphingobium sp. M1R2S20]|uniref:17 kDa surface antigen n=1 Tax=Novosphingobium rhizovicinum TaxID=3228928 RepID=A0ABV3RAC5_9SPHN
MNIFLKVSAIAAASVTIATAAPAVAAPAFSTQQTAYAAPGSESFNQYRDWDRHRVSRDDYRRGYGNNYRNRDARSWRGDNRRYSCRKSGGTTGLLIGGAAGALLGREIDGGRDRTLGTVLGAAGGALLGREVERGGSRCR